jgi:hypothetical protein
VFDGLHMVQAGLFDKFLEVVIRLLRLTLEVTLIDHDVLLVGAARFLVGVVVASSNYDPLGGAAIPHFCHLWHLCWWLRMMPPWLRPWAILSSPRIKMASTTSSPEVCQVAISSNSFGPSPSGLRLCPSQSSHPPCTGVLCTMLGLCILPPPPSRHRCLSPPRKSPSSPALASEAPAQPTTKMGPPRPPPAFGGRDATPSRWQC